MKGSRKLGGLYLVVSPVLPVKQLLLATEEALNGGVDLLQLSAGEETADLHFLGTELSAIAKKHEIPFLVDNSLEVAKEVEADGVHLDAFNISPAEARGVLGSIAIVGYTVNMDLEKIKWAEQAGADYVSFCSVFHQCPSNQCPIVSLDTIRNTSSATKLSVFAAGGINLENILLVLDAGVDGVAVTSAILKSKDPQQTAKSFKQIIDKYSKKN
jgi:thiamine-phosphate diphosphorylase